MKTSPTWLILISVCFCLEGINGSICAQEQVLAKPSDIQYRWHEQERIMFACLDPCTWQGREYDNHSTPLSRINPSKLNTDQWCEVAISWGAKETELASGSAAGRMKIDHFPDISVSKVRLKITKSTSIPLLRSFSIYNVADYIFKPEEYATNEWKQCGSWDTKTFVNGKGNQSFNLSTFITKPGQYEVVFTSSVVITGMKVMNAKIFFDNDNLTQQSFIQRKDASNTFYINRTAQVAGGSSSVLEVDMSSDNAVFQNRGEIKIREREAGK